MSKRFHLNFLSRKGGSSILGLTFDGGRLEGVVVRRTNGSVQIQQSFSTVLSLDPLTNDPVLVGREIRNHLDAAGVRERRCVVGLPLQWALTTHTKIPDIPEPDVGSFLQIEAERGFPCDVNTLMRAASRSKLGTGERHATLIGIPRSHVERLEQVLRAAQLKPASFSLGLAALQPPEAEVSNGVLVLGIGESQVGLQLTAGGGIAALRTLEGVIETEGGKKQLRADVLARETRITLAQLPPELRASVHAVRIFGPRELAQQLADEIELRLEALDLDVQVVSSYSPAEFKVEVPAGNPVKAAFSLAAQYVGGQPSSLEFLPPHVTPLQEFAAKYSGGKWQQAGLAAAAVVLLAGGAFLVQQIQIWRLQAQWSKLEKPVGQLKALNAKINQYRPFYDESIRGLNILRALTEAFPEDGSVTAKTIEIRDLTTVTCTGTARDHRELMKILERLRTLPQTQQVNLGPSRGQPPAMQFTFTLVWNEGGRSGN